MNETALITNETQNDRNAFKINKIRVRNERNYFQNQLNYFQNERN